MEDLAGRELGAARQVVCERLAHAFAGARAVGDRGIHLAAGLLHHAENVPSASPAATSSLVPPYAASSKSWMAALPLSARCVMTPRR